MSKVVVLNDKLEKAELDLPSKYAEVNPHNLYLYVKSYLASLRANTAHTKGRSDVSGGGKNLGDKKVVAVLERVQQELTFG